MVLHIASSNQPHDIADPLRPHHIRKKKRQLAPNKDPPISDLTPDEEAGALQLADVALQEFSRIQSLVFAG